MMEQKERRRFLTEALLKENDEYKGIEIPSDEEGQKQLLRGLMNVRPAASAPENFLSIQDEYLKEEIAEKGITDVDSLETWNDGLCLWRGDITTLRCDAIVNAANSGMTGCYIPNHRCIDNAIHTYAGVQLRMACAKIMAEHGEPEPTGRAKITPAFDLPCRFVIHTVGPIVSGRLTNNDREALASCYRECLRIAADKGLGSIAFCCISTGEFRFPRREAAEIAVSEVRSFMKRETSVKKVIFNVFKEEDEQLYRELLG